MKVLLAPDKFKGSLTAQQVCEAMAQVLMESPFDIQVVQHPLADGGEGSCELLTTYSEGYFRKVIIRDPLFRFRESGYGVSKDGTTAFLEMAKASGLQLLHLSERNPTLTTTFGTGQLIVDAIEHGARHIVLGVGGSATNDGGMGMAQALGLNFYDENERKLDPVGKNLKHVAQIDSSGLHPGFRQVSFTMFCDVNNLLHGPQGAAYVFAPQKGATPLQVEELNEGLVAYEKLLTTTFKKNVNFPGAGAGGGLPASLQALTDLTLRPGVEFVMEFTEFKKRIREADVVITGEGKLDEQTLSGKVVNGVACLARKYQKPVYAVVGRDELSAAQWAAMGLARVVELSGKDLSLEESIKNPIPLLKKRIEEEIIPLLLSGQAD